LKLSASLADDFLREIVAAMSEFFDCYKDGVGKVNLCFQVRGRLQRSGNVPCKVPREKNMRVCSFDGSCLRELAEHRNCIV
jgi:hypothetical protein